VKQLVLAATFVAANAFAQEPVVGPEVISDPIGASAAVTGAGAPAVRVIPDDGGFVVAWGALADDQHFHVYAGRADASLHLVPGSVRMMPAWMGTDADADNLNIIRSGSGYIAAWLEASRSGGPAVRLAVTTLDASLNPSPPRLLLSANALPPRLARLGDHVLAAGGRTMFPLDGSGTPTNIYDAGVDADDIAVANGEIFITSHKSTHTPGLCLICRGPIPAVDAYDMTLVRLFHGALVAPTQGHLSSYATALGSDGSNVLLAWYDATAENGGALFASYFRALADDRPFREPMRLGSIHRDLASPIARQPQVASDGRRFVVVWQDRSGTDAQRDILGAVIIPEERRVVPFTIAASDADETEPSIVAVADGEYVVAYNSKRDGVRRIAGRYVYFPPSRPRAVR
jgi:hypothetical protein